MAEDAGSRDGFLPGGRFRALGRAVLYILLVLALVITGILLLPGLAAADLPAGDGMPVQLIGQFVLMLVAALVAAWALRRLVERRPAGDLGFPLTRRASRELGVGILLGLAAMTAVIAILGIAGVYRWAEDGGTAAGWVATAAASLAAFAIPAAAEEAVFRGYLLDSLRDAAGPAAAVLITSVLFAVLHGGNPAIGPFAFGNLLLAGILLGVAVLRTGTLWLATGVHLGWNWAMAGPLDLPVSGLDAYDTPLYDTVATPPVWLSGGAFGPEGGLAGTAAACTALGLIVWLTRPGARLAPPPTIGRRG